MIGLTIITFGSGCIKPCSNTFGGDQYATSDVRGIGVFFSLNYFVFNCGSIFSRLFNPLFREEINCFGEKDCYALVFGLPGVLMIVAGLWLLAGKRYYVCHKPKGNMFLKFCGCIWVRFKIF